MKTQSKFALDVAKLSASLLTITSFSTTAADANPARDAQQWNALNARGNWRAEHRGWNRTERIAPVGNQVPTATSVPMAGGIALPKPGPTSTSGMPQMWNTVSSDVKFRRHGHAHGHTGRAERLERREDQQNNRQAERPQTNARSHVSHAQNRVAETPQNSNNSRLLYPGQLSEFRTTRPATTNRVQGRSTFVDDNGQSTTLAHGVSLDLSSTEANITVGNNLLDGTITINVGGETKTISAGSKVTAAEFAAVNQMLATGNQALTLSSNGAALSGTLSLNQVSDDGTIIRASELVIPENVKVEGDFGRTADGVRVQNDIVNSGSLVAYSTNANRNTAVIAAKDINNETGATIASVSSASNPNLNLSLRADRDLANSGTIESSGDLELVAGGSITNSQNASARANGNVVLNASSILNQGNVSAQRDITLNANADTNLQVNNSGGTLSAVNGDINLRETAYSGIGNSIIYGGDLFSKAVNINAGNGTGDIVVNELTGAVHSTGNAAHVSANTADLIIGSQCLTGDPTYFNTGNITIGGNIIVGEALAIIAGGDITTNQTNLTIKAQTGGGAGAEIHIVAGANITAGTNPISPPILTNASQIASTPVTVDGSSITGGSIDLTTATTLTIESNSISANTNGATIVLMAYQADVGTGQVILSNGSTINSSGTGTGNNGNIVVGAQIISLGSIVNNGNQGGTVEIRAGNPMTTDFNPITFGTNGTITSGNELLIPVVGGPGTSVNIQSVTTAGSNITIEAGGPITVGMVDTSSPLAGNNGGNFAANSANGLVSIASITTAGNSTGSGGTVTVNSDRFDLPSINTSGGAIGGNGALILLYADNTSVGNPAAIGTVTSTANGAGLGGSASISVTGSGGLTVGAGVTMDLSSVNGDASGLGLYLTGGPLQFLGGNVLIDVASNTGNGSFLASGMTSIDFGATNLTVLSNGSGYAQSVYLIPVAGGTVSGAGGDLTMIGKGSVALGNLGAITMPGSNITLNAGGTVDFTGASVNTSAQTANQSGGNISLIGSAVSASSLTTSGLGSGNGGSITIDAGISGLTVGSMTANGGTAGTGGTIQVTRAQGGTLNLSAITSTGGTADGDISVTVVFGGNINVTGAITGKNVTLNPTTGSILLGADVIASGNIALTSQGLTQSTGVVSGNQLTVNIGVSGNTTLTTDINVLNIAVANDVIVTNQNGIIITSTAVDNVTVTATTGDIQINTSVGANESYNLTALDGAILVNSFITADDISLSATGGINGTGSLVAQNNIDLSATNSYINLSGQLSNNTGRLLITLDGLTPGNAVLSGNNNLVKLEAGGTGGTITFNNSANALNLGVLGSDQTLVVTTTSAAGVTTTSNISTSGDITINAPKLTNAFDVSAQSITIQNLSGNLEIDGGAGGSMTGLFPTAGPPGSPSDPYAINIITMSGATLTLSGTMDLTGDVLLSNQSGTTISNTASLWTGTNNIILNATTYQQIGGGQIVADDFIFLGKSIVNPTGSVTLGGNVTYNGRDLTIAALNDVILGTITINLSSATANAGSLTIIAGFQLVGLTGGQAETEATFTIGAPSVAGGDVIGGNSSIITSTTGGTGDAGNVIVVASGGDISLGTIDASSVGGSGGDVTVIASVIHAGDIVNSGATDGGDVLIGGSAPSCDQPVTIFSGRLSTGGFFESGLQPGNVTLANVTSGQGTIKVNTDLTNSLAVTGSLSANEMRLISGSIVFTTANNLTAVAESLTGDGGLINIFTGSITGSGSTFAVRAQGTGAGDGGRVNLLTEDDMTLGTTGNLIVDVSGPGSGGQATIQSEGNITVNAGGIIAAGANGDGALLEVDAAVNDFIGTLTINDATFIQAANASSTNGNGGKISLGSEIFVSIGTAASPLLLTAHGNGTGNGGTVDFSSSSTNPVYIGTPAKAPKGLASFITINAESGLAGGNGGTVGVFTQGNLFINASNIVAGPHGSADADGAAISLTAFNPSGKTGSVIITGSLNANAIANGEGGSIRITSQNKKAFVLNTSKTPKNGITGTLSAQGSGGRVSISNQLGNITVSTSAALDADFVDLIVEEKGSITAASGVPISAGEKLEMTATNSGNIGKKPLLVAAPTLSLSTSSGSINVASVLPGLVTLTSASAGKDITLITTNGLFVDANARTDSGDITLIAGGGTLTVDSGRTITANNGSLTLANTDTANGDIFIDVATVQTQGKGGNTNIAIGDPPKKGTNPGEPAGFDVTTEGKGLAYFGPGGVDSLGTVTVNALNKNVIFNNLSSNVATKRISIADGATITADPPSRSNTNVFPQLVNMSSAFTSQQNINSSATTPAISVSLPVPVDKMALSTATINTLITPGFTSGARTGSYTAVDTNYGVGSSNGHASELAANAANNFETVDLSVDGVIDTNQNVTSRRIEEGTFIFSPSGSTTIETEHGSIKLAAGAIAIVSNSKTGLGVFNIHDKHKDSVVLNVHNKLVSLPPGRHAHVSDQWNATYAEVNPIELIQHRALNQSPLKNGWSVYTSEFAIPSACYAVKPLRKMMASNDVIEKRMAKQILKTSSVIMTLCPDRGDFVQHFNPRMTAAR